MTKPAHRLPPKRTPFKQPKPRPAKNYYQLEKYKTLRYNYAEIENEELRERVLQVAVEIRGRLKATVDDMIEIGRDLKYVQEFLPPGRFYEWAQVEFGMSRGSVFEFVQIATRFATNRSKFERILPSIVRRLAAPSVPDEAVEAVLTAAANRKEALPFKEAMAIVKPYMPVKVAKPKQLTGPVASTASATLPNPQVGIGSNEITIDAEYSVLAEPEPLTTLTFADWLAAMPTDLGVRDHLAILELAKASATKLRQLRPSLHFAVSNATPTWSQLMIAVEKELKHD